MPATWLWFLTYGMPACILHPTVMWFTLHICKPGVLSGWVHLIFCWYCTARIPSFVLAFSPATGRFSISATPSVCLWYMLILTWWFIILFCLLLCHLPLPQRSLNWTLPTSTSPQSYRHCPFPSPAPFVILELLHLGQQLRTHTFLKVFWHMMV